MIAAASLTWCITQSGDDTYAAHVSEITGQSESNLDELMQEVDANGRRCDAGFTTSCDQIFAVISDAADEVQSARMDMAALTPPDDAAAWHRDYLQLLSDGETLLRRMVMAWQRGDLAFFESAQADFDRLSSREDTLVDYFNKNLK